MKINMSWLIFVLGLIPLLAVYYPIKSALPPWQFVLIGISYLLALRLLSDFIAAKISSKKNGKKVD